MNSHNIFSCECSHPAHSLHVYDLDEDGYELCLVVTPFRSFIQRILPAIKYIFLNQQIVIGDILLDKNETSKLSNLLKGKSE